MRLIERVKQAAADKKVRVTAAVAGAVALLLAVLWSADAAASWNKIHPGIKVAAFDVGGMSKSEAAKLLKGKLEGKLKKDVEVTYGKNKWLLSPKQVAFEIDYEKTVSEAYAFGRDEQALSSLYERIVAWGGGTRSPLVFRVDPAKAGQYLVLVNEQIGKKAVDAQVVLEGSEFKVVPGKKGTELDWDKALKDIKVALLSPEGKDRRVALVMKTANPDVSESEAKAAIASAKKLTAEPVELAFQDTVWKLETSDLASLVAFNKAKKKGNFIYEPVIDKTKFAQKVDALTANIIVQPKDAGFQVDGDVVTVVPGENGKKVNPEDAYTKLMAALDRAERKVDMTMVDMEPELTTDEAKSYGIEKKLASFTTYYSPSDSSRVNNIHLIADSINGAIVAPNEVFSVNEYVGPRTADKGYREAPVIVNGKLVPGLGGGICQATTTLFNAIFHSGLEIVERTNHAFYISRYPAGLDATVSYGDLDLKFKNDTGYYLLIKFEYTSDSVTAAIYGKDGLGNKVEYSSTPFSNYRGFQTVEQPDAALAKGERVVEQSGVTGRDITVYRTVTRNGKVIHEDTLFSRYDPEDAIVRVGTKEPAPAPAPAGD
ncbi:MAG: VanW family protein [Candidatus Aquicultorales bacterium]